MRINDKIILTDDEIGDDHISTSDFTHKEPISYTKKLKLRAKIGFFTFRFLYTEKL